MGSRWRIAVLALAVLAAVPAAGVRAAAPQRVTMIGDSVADEIAYSARARAILGVRVRLDLAPCRRLVQPSCSVGGIAPPTTLQLIESAGRTLGGTVIVAVGYNDPELLYPHNITLVVRALERVGVQRILWLTLHAAHHSYLSMNDDIKRAATRDRHLEVVDWNRYSRSHPSWFRADQIHLSPPGAIAMARFVHKKLAAAPPR